MTKYNLTQFFKNTKNQSLLNAIATDWKETNKIAKGATLGMSLVMVGCSQGNFTKADTIQPEIVKTNSYYVITSTGYEKPQIEEKFDVKTTYSDSTTQVSIESDKAFLSRLYDVRKELKKETLEIHLDEDSIPDVISEIIYDPINGDTHRLKQPKNFESIDEFYKNYLFAESKDEADLVLELLTKNNKLFESDFRKIEIYNSKNQLIKEFATMNEDNYTREQDNYPNTIYVGNHIYDESDRLIRIVGKTMTGIERKDKEGCYYLSLSINPSINGQNGDFRRTIEFQYGEKGELRHRVHKEVSNLNFSDGKEQREFIQNRDYFPELNFKRIMRYNGKTKKILEQETLPYNYYIEESEELNPSNSFWTD